MSSTTVTNGPRSSCFRCYPPHRQKPRFVASFHDKRVDEMATGRYQCGKTLNWLRFQREVRTRTTCSSITGKEPGAIVVLRARKEATHSKARRTSCRVSSKRKSINSNLQAQSTPTDTSLRRKTCGKSTVILSTG